MNMATRHSTITREKVDEFLRQVGHDPADVAGMELRQKTLVVWEFKRTASGTLMMGDALPKTMEYHHKISED